MLLLFFMDGVKYDMMKKHMPFLSGLYSKPLLSEFGYSCACHATMYTSRYIEEHKTWFIWKKGNNSPYKWLDYIPGLKFCNILPIKLLVSKLTQKLSHNTSYSGIPCLVNLPLKYWSMFEPSESVMWDDPKWKPSFPNLFSIINNNSIKYKIVALHKGTKSEDVFLEGKNVLDEKYDFIYFFIGYTDNIMHYFGEDAIESEQYFKRVDSFIEDTYNKARKIDENVAIIAYSDHGHVDIERPLIDINKYFKLKGLKLSKYIHLIESNYARFWFRSTDEEIEVKNVIRLMEDEGLGYIIDDECKKNFHIMLDSSEHGQLIFYLDSPYAFTKTIWGFGHSVKSGHGYNPLIEKNHGIFCSNKKLACEDEFAHLTDILPSVLAQLNLNTPSYTFRGKNILI